jgi:hypothetical protein
LKNKFIFRIIELTNSGLISWNFKNYTCIKYSKRLIGVGNGLQLVIRKSVKKSYILFKKNSEWVSINADTKEIIELYNYVKKFVC